MASSARVLGVVLALGFTWAIALQHDNLPTLEAKFQQELDQLWRLHRFPGATAAFVLPEGQHRVFATGYADREQGIQMSPDSLQLAGSVGKSFTAAVVLSLAQDGVLNLDDKVSKWLGQERWMWRLPNQRDITIRTLLNHSSGIPDHTHDERFLQTLRSRLRSNPDFRLSPAELIQFVVDKDALFAAGRQFAYSDTNYILAGMVIERASGSSYFGELVRRFLEPLHLSLTGPADRRGLPSLATGYVGGGNPFGLPRKTVSRSILAVNPMIQWTAGGLVSNPLDLARWAKALYEEKALKKPYLDELLGSVAPDRKGRKYGLGVQIENSEFGPLYGHDGWFPGYRTRMAYFPDHQVAVAIQINTDDQIDTRQCMLSLARTLIRNRPRRLP